MYILRNRYLTIHETMEANARIISILSAISTQPAWHLLERTYKVVKFIVIVKLVENRAKRSDGKVIVEKVMIQINNPGIPRAIVNDTRPMEASHEFDSVLSTAKPKSDTVAIVVAVCNALLRRDVELCEAAERLSWRGGSMACRTPLVMQTHLSEPPLSGRGRTVSAPRVGGENMTCIVGVGRRRLENEVTYQTGGRAHVAYSAPRDDQYLGLGLNLILDLLTFSPL